MLTNQHPEIKKNLQSFPLISKFLPFLFRPILPLHLPYAPSTKKRSDKRFTKRKISSFSGAWRCSVHKRRSARLATVRAKCSCAETGVPTRQKKIAVLLQSGSHGIHFLFAAYGQFGGRKKIGVQHAIGRSYMAHHYHQFSLNGMQQFLPMSSAGSMELRFLLRHSVRPDSRLPRCEYHLWEHALRHECRWFLYLPYGYILFSSFSVCLFK